MGSFRNRCAHISTGFLEISKLEGLSEADERARAVGALTQMGLMCRLRGEASFLA